MYSVVAAILVTFNPELSSFERALSAHMATCVELLVIVDNNSSNAGELEKTVQKAHLSKVIFLPQPENSGIATAQNIGIACARDAGSSHVMLFDQDSIPSPEIVDTLLADEAKLIARGVQVGAIGPSYRDPRSNNYYPQIKIVGSMLKKVSLKPGTEPVEVSFIIASGSLIRIDVLNLVGPMNEEFFVDGVDLEWCLRACAKRFRIFVSTKTVMSHTIGDRRELSLGREISIHSPLRRYYIARNSILLARQPWVPVGYKIRELFCVLTRAPIFLFAVNFDREYIKYMLKGIFHGLLGRGGPYR